MRGRRRSHGMGRYRPKGHANRRRRGRWIRQHKKRYGR